VDARVLFVVVLRKKRKFEPVVRGFEVARQRGKVLDVAQAKRAGKTPRQLRLAHLAFKVHVVEGDVRRDLTGQLLRPPRCGGGSDGGGSRSIVGSPGRSGGKPC
jgi:hypothetical protein